jgi:hypothetical protein
MGVVLLGPITRTRIHMNNEWPSIGLAILVGLLVAVVVVVLNGGRIAVKGSTGVKSLDCGNETSR